MTAVDDVQAHRERIWDAMRAVARPDSRVRWEMLAGTELDTIPPFVEPHEAQPGS